MTMDGREPDGTYQVMQDESCGHILLIPAGEDDVYEWEFARGVRFGSEDEAIAWHDANCPGN
jgi:hypothetical protein